LFRLVEFIKRGALATTTAMETVQAELTEGYVREESLVLAILKVRDPDSLLLTKIDKLPPPCAGTVPLRPSQTR
jgi:hypothetical protein